MSRCSTTGKRRYPSAQKARWMHRSSGKRIRPYPCRHCGGWHVTTQQPRRGRP